MSEMEEATAAKTTNSNVLFHVSLLYNLVLHHERRRPWWSRVEPLLLLGALPLREKHHLLHLTQEEGVRAVVTMNEPAELLPNLFATPVTPHEWRDAGVAQCFGTTSDFSPPTFGTLDRCVEFVHAQVDGRGHACYVHCKAGRGRSTVVVVAFLVRHRGMVLDDALARVRAKRPHVSLHPAQRRMLRLYADAYARRDARPRGAA
ncbi:hypothetical protein PybrP1_005289 [[Pythium] brassicae (nom. inval.)]|nr:hypothetical protein PybrP1_005289 [[Pythium] brassicae (nom. inval.)]